MPYIVGLNPNYCQNVFIFMCYTILFLLFSIFFGLPFAHKISLEFGVGSSAILSGSGEWKLECPEIKSRSQMRLSGTDLHLCWSLFDIAGFGVYSTSLLQLF